MEIKLNLIPPYRKEEILKSRHFGMLIRLEGLLFLLLVILASFLFSLEYILKLNYLTVENIQINSHDKDKYQKIDFYDKEFSQMNEEISSLLGIKNDQLYWSGMLLRLNDIAFEDVELTNLSTKNYNVFLVGKAANRDKLISFKEKLEQDECFSEVRLPLSNLVSKEDIDFQMDLKLKEECLKKK